jgi:putative acetyltransferase
MLVRPATPADDHNILDLHVASIRTLGSESYTDEQVEAWATLPDDALGYPISEEGQYYAVAVRGGERAAFGHLNETTDEYDADAGVEAVYVYTDHVGQGAGGAVLAHLEGYARGGGPRVTRAVSLPERRPVLRGQRVRAGR